MQLNAEHRALIYRMYEVHPKTGRRRFKRCALSLRKGVGKTEFAAWLAACELHPDAPVRCDGFDADGQPVGVGVRDPYIPMVAYTEEQSDELAYACLRVVLSEGPLADDFDIGIERIMRKRGDGKATSLATAPDARDGARTTFQHFDETHRFVLPRLKEAHRTMLANIPKRKIADPWSLETTTSYAPGEESIAEGTHHYALAIADRTVKEPTLFFFHRQASEKYDLADNEDVRAAIIEASGPAAEWSDLDSIMSLWNDPTTDRTYFERVWLNRPVKSADRAFDVEQWKGLADLSHQVKDRAHITLGFDGARFHDATALVATEIESGYQWVAGLWECPFGQTDWEIPVEEVDATLDDIFQRYQVWRMYADPPYWETWLAHWAGKYGDKRVIEWWTNKPKILYALKAFVTAIQAGEIKHSGDEDLARHIGNAYKSYVPQRDEDGRQLWRIYKERADSPFKIDAAMAAVLSWEARQDAVAAGIGGESVYETRGLIQL